MRLKLFNNKLKEWSDFQNKEIFQEKLYPDIENIFSIHYLYCRMYSAKKFSKAISVNHFALCSGLGSKRCLLLIKNFGLEQKRQSKICLKSVPWKAKNTFALSWKVPYFQGVSREKFEWKTFCDIGTVPASELPPSWEVTKTLTIFLNSTANRSFQLGYDSSQMVCTLDIFDHCVFWL